MIQKQSKYKAAIYCRLSSDDGQERESESIQTQKTLLTQYCEQQGFAIGDVYCDDGWSGTNFERPEFQRMIEDIEKGEINLVIVKDLSRFGREYAQTGLYIEHYFEENGIRFIAVGEGIDTLNGTDSILMPITNVINSLYAKEVFRKTKAAFAPKPNSEIWYQVHPGTGHTLTTPNARHATERSGAMNELTYTRVGDYLLPNLILQQQPGQDQLLGRYARMHRAYLREHRPALHNQLLLTGKLYPLLLEIDDAADNRLAAGMPEEMILAELVYN